MGECSQCGQCCLWIALALEKRCSTEQRGYLEQRCTKKDQGFFLAYCPCTHLIVPSEDDLANGVKHRCGIYDVRPKFCRVYKGQDRYKDTVFYKPPTCTMVD